MDIKILDGDNVLRGDRFEAVSGFGETVQKSLISVIGDKGNFIYDRELGSNLKKYISSGETVSVKKVESIVKSAVSRIENVSAEVKNIIEINGKLEITLVFKENDSNEAEERTVII